MTAHTSDSSQDPAMMELEEHSDDRPKSSSMSRTGRLLELPNELFERILESLSAADKSSLQRVSKAFHRVSKSFSYIPIEPLAAPQCQPTHPLNTFDSRSVKITNISDSEFYRQYISRDRLFASQVTNLYLRYYQEELDDAWPEYYPHDELLLLNLPSLSRLTIKSPYGETDAEEWGRKGFTLVTSVIPRAIDPDASFPILQNFTSCRLEFWNGWHETCSADRWLCLLHDPSLRYLFIHNLASWEHAPNGSPPSCHSVDPPCPTVPDIAPLEILSFTECDLTVFTLDHILKWRQARILSVIDLSGGRRSGDADPNPNSYAPSLHRSAGALEYLKWDRDREGPRGDEDHSPMPLGVFTKLRTLYLDLDKLIGSGKGRSVQSLPPNLEVLAVGTFQGFGSLGELEESRTDMALLLGAKQQGLLPRLRRIELDFRCRCHCKCSIHELEELGALNGVEFVWCREEGDTVKMMVDPRGYDVAKRREGLSFWFR